jgi:pimeloyl-ACP methyl ester carboxylesterase
VTTTVVLVEGTWGGTWASDPCSPFRDLLRRRGFAGVLFEGWTTDVDGVPSLWRRTKHADWIAGGHALAYFLERLPIEDRNLIAHSHGANVVLYACALHQIPVRRLITVCSPVRRDMQVTADQAKPHIGRWRHISSNKADKMQRLGELFDGHFGWGERKWAQADENLSIPGIGHSGLLNEPRFLDLWPTDGMFDFLCAEDLIHAEAFV